MTALDDRLANWGECWRARLRLDAHQAASIEGAYRSPQRLHWDTDPLVGVAPVALPELDHGDAHELEGAVCMLDVFHHALVAARYVHRASPAGALITARDVALWVQLEQSRALAVREFEARMRRAKSLIAEHLLLPAVVRKHWARARVRRLLGLERLTVVGACPTIGATI